MAFAITASKAYPMKSNATMRGPFEQVLEVSFTALNTDVELNLATLAAANATLGPRILSVLSKARRISSVCFLESARSVVGVQATGTVTITNVANLLATTPDTIEVAGVVFTAQAGAATPGTATFQAVTDVTTTATSLKTQINAHATAGALVTATSLAGVVTVTSKLYGAPGNSYTLVYTDNGGGNIGATVSGATLSGGLPTTNRWWLTGTANAPVLSFPGGGATPTALTAVFKFTVYNGATPIVDGL